MFYILYIYIYYKLIAIYCSQIIYEKFDFIDELKRKLQVN
jgi:hypothetical protein